MSQTNELAFESYVETILSRSGWQAGNRAEWDVEQALVPARIFAFLQDTQPKLWDEMQKLHGAGLEHLLIATLVKELDVKGMLHILRHGFKFYGKTFRLAYFKPAHGLSYEVLELFKKTTSPSRGKCSATPESRTRWTWSLQSMVFLWPPAS